MGGVDSDRYVVEVLAFDRFRASMFAPWYLFAIFPHRGRYRQKRTVPNIVPMVERSGANNACDASRGPRGLSSPKNLFVVFVDYYAEIWCCSVLLLNFVS